MVMEGKKRRIKKKGRGAPCRYANRKILEAKGPTGRERERERGEGGVGISNAVVSS